MSLLLSAEPPAASPQVLHQKKKFTLGTGTMPMREYWNYAHGQYRIQHSYWKMVAVVRVTRLQPVPLWREACTALSLRACTTWRPTVSTVATNRSFDSRNMLRHPAHLVLWEFWYPSIPRSIGNLNIHRIIPRMYSIHNFSCLYPCLQS